MPRPRRIDDEAFTAPGQATKTLMVLGLLQRGPTHGYELYRVISAHSGLYSELKKPTLYHLLQRMDDAGLVSSSSQGGARGRRGERLIYRLTRRGRTLFERLLRDTIAAYQPIHSGLDVAIVYLSRLPVAEARALIRARRDAIRVRRKALVADHNAATPMMPATRRVTAHLSTERSLALIDAELVWIERTLKHLNRRKAWIEGESQ
ncbi:MAG: PadR family transcriptional regulator [Rhodobacteraceae bacterium]|nr:PadR family transcriptional regulator [Paracoccaceae bacterium]